MKTIGFIKKHEDKILGNVIEYNNDDTIEEAINKSNIECIIRYLSNGSSIFTMTLALSDDKGKVIGPYEILTDGEWIWPRYYSYYIKMEKVTSINQMFLNRIKSTNCTTPEMSIVKEKEAKEYFLGLLLRNNQSLKKDSKL